MNRMILALLAMLISTNATANDVVATAEMGGDGMLFLYNTHTGCDEKSYTARLISSIAPPLTGCWMYNEKAVYVFYDDKDIRRYPVDKFTLREPVKKDEVQ